METQVIQDKYKAWLSMARNAREMRINNASEHFWRELEERGAITTDCFYKTTPEDVETVRRLLDQEQQAIKVENNVSKAMKNHAFLKDCAEYIFENNEIILKSIETFEAYTDEEIEAFYNSHLDKEKAELMLSMYAGQEPGEDVKERLTLMDVGLTAELIAKVNETSCGTLLSDVKSLLSLTLEENGTFEVFLTGTEQSERFLSWTKTKEEKLRAAGMIEAKNGGVSGLLFHSLKTFGHLYGWDVQKVTKATGEKEKRESIVRSRKGKSNKLPRLVGEQKRTLKEELTPQRKMAGELTRLEERYYETIGDRAILVRRPVVSMSLYEETRNYIQGTGDYEAEFVIT